MKKHIMFVDDEIDVGTLINFYFEKSCDLKVHFKESVDKAIETLNSFEGQEIKMVFSDINMPQKDGFVLLKYIKENYPHIKVYMVSGYDMPDYHEKAYELGSEGFFGKPMNLNKIKEVIS